MKSLFFLICLLFLPILAYTQPIPCADPPMMTSFCKDACIICDIDGFTGRNNSQGVGEAPDDFCTTVLHNGQWIGFIAGTPKLVIRLDVSNCISRNGLEVGLYEGINCDNFRQVSFCDTRVETSQTFTAEDLTIGQYYYLIMDGSGGNVCDWTFTVLEGDTRVAPLETSGNIFGNFESCPGVEKTFVLDKPVGATEFLWEVNGVNQFNNDSVFITSFPENGVYNICATAFNVCNAAPPTCQQVVVRSIPTTDLGKQVICLGDNFEVNDSILTQTDFYEFHIILENGCDSIVLVDLEVFEPTFTDFGRVNICSGDALPIGDKLFSETGFYTEVLTNEVGCDSTVTLDLFTVECNIEGSATPTTAICHGEASGSIDFFITNGSPPFDYRWESIDKTTNGMGRVDNLNTPITIPSLSATTYLITITDDFSELENVEILFGEVPQPPKLTTELITSDYNGYTNACHNSEDGWIKALPTGGMPPYQFDWNTAATQNEIISLAEGNYTVSIQDDLGCVRETSVLLEGPPPIELQGNYINSTCESLTSGKILLQTIGGGVAPYQYSLSGQSFQEEPNFENLGVGSYSLFAIDENNCVAVDTGRLTAPVIPVIDLGEDKSIELADGIFLVPNTFTGADSIVWRPDPGLSCYDCKRAFADPVNPTTYFVSGTSADNCTTTDSIRINVLKVYDVYAPNVFSPNSDGINDSFYLFGGPEVQAISSFRIFSRWGDLIYEQPTMVPNDGQFGWDGTWNGSDLTSGVFIWIADITFIDGVSLVYSGDVTILK